jgi:hypothetical protein
VWIPDNANFGVPSTPKGQNGLDWSADPRPAVQPFLRIGADGSTPIYPPGVPWSLTDDSPVPLATGQEARLIEAEASLRAGDASWLPILNALRAGSAFALQLPPLTDPGTTASRVDILFRERAMWMYLTGHRLGDLRRLVRQYGRSQDQVFPTGPYPKGGEFGSDVNITPPYAERNNPTYHGCLDRAA